MRKTIACVAILGVSACASHESAERPTTARAERADAVRNARRDPGDVRVVDTDSPHDKPVVDSQRLVVDTHTAVAVEPAPIAAVPSRSELNERDRDYDDRPTADKRANASDAEITRRIRKAVVSDDNLTVAAKNVKIATEDGHVTLRGNVRDAREKDTVASHARDVAGVGNVDNQIGVSN